MGNGDAENGEMAVEKAKIMLVLITFLSLHPSA